MACSKRDNGRVRVTRLDRQRLLRRAPWFNDTSNCASFGELAAKF